MQFTDVNARLTTEYSNDSNSLGNPYGQMTCLILYMYSMEFGEPQLYSEVNRVCRHMDETHLETLGPFI